MGRYTRVSVLGVVWNRYKSMPVFIPWQNNGLGKALGELFEFPYGFMSKLTKGLRKIESLAER